MTLVCHLSRARGLWESSSANGREQQGQRSAGVPFRSRCRPRGSAESPIVFDTSASESLRERRSVLGCGNFEIRRQTWSRPSDTGSACAPRFTTKETARPRSQVWSGNPRAGDASLADRVGPHARDCAGLQGLRICARWNRVVTRTGTEKSCIGIWVTPPFVKCWCRPNRVLPSESALVRRRIYEHRRL